MVDAGTMFLQIVYSDWSILYNFVAERAFRSTKISYSLLFVVNELENELNYCRNSLRKRLVWPWHSCHVRP